MNIIKKTAFTLFLAITLGAGSVAIAEESANSAAIVSEIITHIEKAIVEVDKSDFNSAQVHLKAARIAAEKITGHEDIVKQANNSVIQGQKQAKLGDVKKADEELNKAITLYKSL